VKAVSPARVVGSAPNGDFVCMSSEKNMSGLAGVCSVFVLDSGSVSKRKPSKRKKKGKINVVPR